jgi:hypothetical protein
MRHWAIALLVLSACRPSAPDTEQQVRRLADDVIPRVEQSVGLRFKTSPHLAVRDRAAVERYLRARLDQEYPADRLANVATAYRLVGLIPDTLDLRALLLTVLGEQVAGYYDPDSLTLYVVQGADPAQVRIVLAHELVHALQGQYAPLDSLMSLQRENDRQLAVQAVLEGQATLASLTAMLDSARLSQLGDFWGDVRTSIRHEQERMPLFASAPLFVRQELLFPYLAGADFMRWFEKQYPDTMPFGRRMPQSTEQILYPDQYAAGDEPVELRFAPASAAGRLVYDDTFGQFETQIILWQHTGSESVGNAGALGWNGDRFAVYRDASGDALVWWSVWASPQFAKKFADMLDRSWSSDGPGRRWVVRQGVVGGEAAVVLVDAPPAWGGWTAIPKVAVHGEAGGSR